jgi:NTP pyrophosphatase (non-canonical NTP hydrolase)
MKDLSEIQRQIGEARKKRGFVTDPTKIQILLTEEIGEISSELKRLWSMNYGEFNPDRLSDEIADAFVLLCALALEFDIDIGQAVESKFFSKDAARRWKSAE